MINDSVHGEITSLDPKVFFDVVIFKIKWCSNI